MKRRGFFITFEGPEGSGKSTVIKETARFLEGKGFSVLVLREPGGTVISEKIREILLDGKNIRMAVEAELFLYLAARAQLVREVIRPALASGKIVICDRFHDSTRAYQGYAGGISLKSIGLLGKLATEGLEPDLTILLDVAVEKGLSRAGRHDRMEKKSLGFHKRVRLAFLSLARKYPHRIFVVKDENKVEEKIARVLQMVHGFVNRRFKQR